MADKTVAHFEVSKEMLQQISQSMLECKKMGRSLENSADALIPLTDHPGVQASLKAMAHAGQLAAKEATMLYQLIAREAATP